MGGPYHRLTVGRDQLAAVDDPPQALVLLHRDHLRRVHGHMLDRSPGVDRALAAGDDLIHLEPVDCGAEELGALAVPALRVCRRGLGGTAAGVPGEAPAALPAG